MKKKLVVAALLGLISSVAAAQKSKATVPFCPGLTIVTAVSQQQGDYESIKRIESVTRDGARIRYSSYMPDPEGDYDSTTVAPPPWVPFTVHRTVRTSDLESSASYLQQFSPGGVPETVRGTTALGISRTSFRELRDKGKTALSIFQVINPAVGIDEDGKSQMAGTEYRLPGELARIDPTPQMVNVLVNNKLTALPALRARGMFLWDDSEFFFLFDETNPITLKFRIGIAPPPTPEIKAILEQYPDPQLKRKFEDRDVLQVVKISHQCEDPSLVLTGGGKGKDASGGGGGAGPVIAGSGAGSGGSGGTGPSPTGGGGGGAGGGGGGGGAGKGTGAGGGAAAGGGSQSIEESLAKTGRAEIYSIYFAFNSDQIREESEPTLQEIADVMRKHPDWKLSIEGHTDNIASDAFNLKLSQRRADAVKNALVSKKNIVATRFATAGYGEGRPRDTNETLEGRARNRRVELVKTP